MSTAIRRRIGIVIAGMAVIVAGAAVAFYGQIGPQRTESISGSYSFDVNDPKLVAGFADVIVIGRVDAIGDTVPTPIIATKFEVTVVKVLMGKVEGSTTFLQYGGTRGKTTWVVEDQQMLAQGRTYLLAGGRSEHGVQLIGGPVAVQRLDTPAAQERAAAEWRDHIAHRRAPRTNQ